VKIPGRERYITDSKTAAKPSSDFTIHGCQALQASVLEEVLQTNQIELQNFLHSPRTRGLFLIKIAVGVTIRVAIDVGVGRPSIYATASVRIYPDCWCEADFATGM
jgi:hypothetical protein